MRSLATMLGESLEEPIEFSNWRTAMVIDRATDKLRELIRAQAPPVAESAGSDTPRTDAEEFLLQMTPNPEDPGVFLVCADFARQLERELSDAKGELEDWDGLAKEYFQMVPGEHGEGEEIPGTPKSIRQAVNSLEEEWDNAERRVGKAERELLPIRKQLADLRKGISDLLKAKGRFNTQQAYEALAALDKLREDGIAEGFEKALEADPDNPFLQAHVAALREGQG